MTGESPAPAGAAADAGDAGDAGCGEILAELNALLEAERAGAHVALASAKAAGDPAYGRLMHAVRTDEARWCAMLSEQIRRLGGTASRRTGAFREKALAIPDLLDRLAFLNRGQAWVVRRLETLTPRVRDESLRQDLHRMLESHRDNIALAEALLEGERPAP